MTNRTLTDNTQITQDLTVPGQVKLNIAGLPLFSSSAAGAAPASGGGTSNFLRADGSWATANLASTASGSYTVALNATANSTLLLPKEGTLLSALGNKTYSIKHDGTGDFTDLNAALSYFQKAMPLGGAALNLDAGVHSYTATVYVGYNWFKGVNIQGVTPIATATTSIAGSSGSAGAWSLTLNVASTAGITTGMYAVISGASGGTNPTYVEGVWPVTAVGSGTITISTAHRSALVPSGAVAATVQVPPSILKFTGCDGFDIWDGASAINMGNVVIVGDGVSNTNGISLQDTGRLNAGGVIAIYGFGGYNFYANLNTECNTTGALLVSSGSAKVGFFTDTGAIIDCDGEIIASGNGGAGIFMMGGSYVRSQAANGILGSGNAGDGIFVTDNSVIYSGLIRGYGNTQYGIHTTKGGRIASDYFGGLSDNGYGAVGTGFQIDKGTLLATPLAGQLEYDGNTFYASPVASVRGVLAVKQRSAVETNLNLSASAAAAQSFLPAGAQTFPVVAGVRYRIKARIQLYWPNNTNTGTVSVVFTLGGGATATFIRYTALSVEGANATIAPTPAIIALVNGAAAAVVTTTSTNVIKDIEIDGTAEFSAGGTITPKVQWSADTSGTAPQAILSSYFELETLTTGLATSGLT